mgnify:CR=1 FL=1
MVEETLYIIKRDGRKELLDISKVHKMTEAACNGLTGVSPSLVESLSTELKSWSNTPYVPTDEKAGSISNLKWIFSPGHRFECTIL